jgi:hypothetical protein
MPRQVRLDRLMTATGRVCESHGLPADAVTVNRVEHDVRVVVALRQPVAPADKPALLMRLEAAVQEAVDGRLELVLEEVKDANVLRRPRAMTRGEAKVRVTAA